MMFLTVYPLPTWSLVSLILAISGVLLWIFTMVRSSMGKRSQLRTVAHSQNNTTEGEEGTVKSRKLCSILIGLMAVVGILVFIIFNDMRWQVVMVMVNRWTILNVIIYAIAVVATVLRRKPLKEKKKA